MTSVAPYGEEDDMPSPRGDNQIASRCRTTFGVKGRAGGVDVGSSFVVIFVC
jgi:hypothetical protein